MAQHRWVGLGASPMTAEQAKEWAGLSGRGVVETPLDALFSSMLCVVCLEHWGDTLPQCAGLPSGDGNEHVWQAFLTAPASDDDAAAWADPDGEYLPGHPQSVAVLCVLCGQSADAAEAECGERVFWTRDSSLKVAISDFTEPLEPATERIPMFARLSDQDADLHIVADPAEADAEEWRLFEVRADGTREEIERTEFWSTGLGDHQGRPGWYAEGFGTNDIEMHIPGRSTPYIVSEGRDL